MDQQSDRELNDAYVAMRQHGNFLEAKELYFREILPRLRPAIENRPEHVRLREQHVETLISLMGFSPETTVISTLILRPKKLLVAYSHEAVDVFNSAMRYLIEERVMRYANVQHCSIDGLDPNDIYAKLDQLIPLEGNRVFDVTGGTKLMSATAGYLAWEHGLALCYLDGKWDPKIGAAGLEEASHLRLYSNPSQQQGYAMRNQAVDLYVHGSFAAARKAFEQSRNRIDDDAFEHFGISLCKCYAAFADLNRDQLEQHLTELREIMNFGGVRKLYEGRVEMEGHVRALTRLAHGDRQAITAAFLELAEVYRRQERHDFASLLIYRAMEAIVEAGLQAVHPEFEMSQPDYSLLSNVASLEAQAAALEKGRGRGLPPAVGLEAGFALLLILKRVSREPFGDMRDEDILGRIKGYAGKRNQSVLAHGNRTLTAADSQDLLAGANTIARAILGDAADDFESLRRDLRVRDLPVLKPDDGFDLTIRP